VQSSAFSADRTQANRRLPRPRFCQEGTKDGEKKNKLKKKQKLPNNNWGNTHQHQIKHF